MSETSFFIDILIKIVVSLFSSALFIFYILRKFKPKIKISNRICFEDLEDGTRLYKFKIVNLSMYDAYTVEYELKKRTPYIVDKSKVNHKIDDIPFKKGKQSLYSIPRCKKEIGYGEHAILIGTTFDLSKDIDEKNLEFMLFVSAKHGLSNLTKVTTQTFENSDVFHKGSFKFGRNLGVC